MWTEYFGGSWTGERYWRCPGIWLKEFAEEQTLASYCTMTTERANPVLAEIQGSQLWFWLSTASPGDIGKVSLSLWIPIRLRLVWSQPETATIWWGQVNGIDSGTWASVMKTVLKAQRGWIMHVPFASFLKIAWMAHPGLGGDGRKCRLNAVLLVLFLLVSWLFLDVFFCYE